MRRRVIASLERKFTLALTGTPLENKIAELVSILDLALPGMARLMEARGSLGNPSSSMEWASPFLMRRTKEKHCSSLRPMKSDDVYLEMSPGQREVYTVFIAQARASIEEAINTKGEARGTIEQLAALTRLRQICIDARLVNKESEEICPKIKTTVEMLRTFQKTHESVLVFSQFTEALNLLQIQLEEEGIPFLRLDGSTPRKKRAKLVQEFQTSDVPFAFLISLRAGGTGLNLTRATKVITMDNWWNPAVDDQAIARAHRIGQKKEVTVHRLVMKGTIEERVLQLQAEKQALFESLVGAPSARKQAGGGGLTAEDFKFLLS